MLSAVQVRDETTAGDCLHAFRLELTTPTITARDLIRARVLEEVRRHGEQRRAHGLRGLLGSSGGQSLDAEAQVDIALRGFAEQGFLLLVDDRQIESLDDRIPVSDDSQVVFLRLVPLAGG